MSLILILFFALIFGTVGAVMAGDRGRSQLAWFIICLIFPLIGNILLAVLSNLNEEKNKKLELQNTKVCPQCAERVQLQAKICRYCQHKFDMTNIPIQTKAIANRDIPALMKQYGIEYHVLKDRFTYKSESFKTFKEAYNFATQAPNNHLQNKHITRNKE